MKCIANSAAHLMLCYAIIVCSIAAEPRADCELYKDVNDRKYKAQHYHILQATEMLSQCCQTRPHARLGAARPMHNTVLQLQTLCSK